MSFRFLYFCGGLEVAHRPCEIMPDLSPEERVDGDVLSRVQQLWCSVLWVTWENASMCYHISEARCTAIVSLSDSGAGAPS